MVVGSRADRWKGILPPRKAERLKATVVVDSEAEDWLDSKKHLRNKPNPHECSSLPQLVAACTRL